MAKAELDNTGALLIFECPGCMQGHAVPVLGSRKWEWNGSLDSPTLSPSILCRWTQGEEHAPRVCHSFVKNGRIEFLGDCTHALAGQIVDLPEREP